MKTIKITDIWPKQVEFRIKVIKSVIPKSGVILDIGSGGVKYRTRNSRLITMDIVRGRPTTWGNAECLPFKTGTFDLVISTELIEHVMYPKKFINEVYRVLKPRGRWLMSTPNVATLVNRFALFFYGRFPPDRSLHDGKAFGHVHFWDKKYLIEVLTSNGFAVDRTWYKFLQISSSKYITDSFVERIFKDYCDQNLYLCRKVKKSKEGKASGPG